jgi:pimeloyl-ACP methyl ester carboxylesterase
MLTKTSWGGLAFPRPAVARVSPVPEERAKAGSVEIVYETIGDPDAQALLLVMGLGMQLIHWDLEFCRELADRGFRVIRFDNRDAGRSTQIKAPVPSLARMLAARPVQAPYLLDDMARDAIGLLDHLGIERAHVAGASLGGMIAQSMAIARPERVSSLASIMSTTGNRRVGFPRLRALGVLLRRAPNDRGAYVESSVRVFRQIGSTGFAFDEARIRAQAAAAFDRGYNPAGTGRQLAAILASGDRTARLRELRVPTAVIHGSDDPLIPVRAGVATARAIPDSEFLSIEGMGHDLPRAVWPRVIDAVVANAARARAAQPARA